MERENWPKIDYFCLCWLRSELDPKLSTFIMCLKLSGNEPLLWNSKYQVCSSLQSYSLNIFPASCCASASLNTVYVLLHGLISCRKLRGFCKGHLINAQHHRQIHRVGFHSCMPPSSVQPSSNPRLETHSNSEGKVLPETMLLPFTSHRSTPWGFFPLDILYCISIQSFCCTPGRMNIFKIPFCISGTLSRKCFSGWLGKSSLLFAIRL